MAGGLRCWRLQLLPLLLLLLLLATGKASNVWEDDESVEEEAAEETAVDEEDDEDRRSLLELRSLLQRRLADEKLDLAARGKKSSSSGLKAVYKAAKVVGAAEDKALRRADKRKRKRRRRKRKKKGPWYAFLLKLPLPALIAAAAGAVLLLAVVLGLLIYCCCCRDSSGVAKRKRGPPQTIRYGDIDLLGGEKPPYGTINYSLEYDLKRSSLNVTVSNCQDLPRGLDSLDPYVTVTITDETDPKKPAKMKTSKIVKNTSNPVFNFGCSFPVKKRADLRKKVITFEVFDWDLGNRHDMVARKVIHLRKLGENLDTILGRNVDFTKNLHKGLEPENKGPGDICVSLYYAAKDKSLTVTVVECKGVFISKAKEKPDLDTLPNTFVNVVCRSDITGKEQTKRTDLVKHSRNPYFNREFCFSVGTIEQLESTSLRLQLLHKTETLGIKRVIGSLVLGSDADPSTLPYMHWQELMAQPNHATARWHNLITPPEAERQRKAKEREERRRMQEEQEEAEMIAALQRQHEEEEEEEAAAAAQ